MAINKTDKVLNVPTLRFPGFTDKWETSRLSSYLIENKERNRNNEFGKDKVLSVSGEEGIVNQIEHLGRSFAGKSVSDYHVVRHGNIVYTKSPLKEYPYGIVKYNRGVDGIVSTLYAVYESKDSSYGPFVEYYFALATRVNRYFKPIVRIGAKHDMKIGNEEVLQNTVIFPNIEEQKKIADFLSLLDERIALQSKLIEDLKKLKSAIRAAIFQQLKKTANQMRAGAELLEYEQPTKYLVSDTEYSQDKSLTPVLTANKSLILGYTDEKFGIYKKGDCIILDDFTLDLKYIKFPFKVKSSAIKILRAKNGVSLRYMYEYLNWLELTPLGHNRHYISMIEPMQFYCPEVQVQEKIATTLEKADEKIQSESRLFDVLTRQKYFLLSAMFI